MSEVFEFEIPWEPSLNGIQIPVHLIFEYLAFIIGFIYYHFLRKKYNDEISHSNRLSIILGAIIGALIGSRFFAWLEQPTLEFSNISISILMNTKTIMGGLFGGLIGVELAKKFIGERKSSGDLFVFPLILGIIIGRWGCFFSGINEFTYGSQTNFVLGMDLGDGLTRHPIALYEIIFLILLFMFLQQIKKIKTLKSGMLFKYFMITYFTFRFSIEFIKPNEFFILGLSSIQWLSIICLLYYNKTICRLFRK